MLPGREFFWDTVRCVHWEFWELTLKSQCLRGMLEVGKQGVPPGSDQPTGDRARGKAAAVFCCRAVNERRASKDLKCTYLLSQPPCCSVWLGWHVPREWLLELGAWITG